MRSKSLLVALLLANAAVAAILAPSDDRQNPSQESAATLPGQHLELVSELAVESVAELPASSSNESVSRECRVWGPESEPEAFEQLSAALEAVGGLPQVQPATVSGSPDQLVYVSGLNSRDQARQVARELEAMGTESYLLDTEDELRLSVGVFSQASRAENQRQKVARLGYDVVVLPMPRTQVVYNLVAHVPIDHPSYETSISSCTSIAQTQ